MYRQRRSSTTSFRKLNTIPLPRIFQAIFQVCCSRIHIGKRTRRRFFPRFLCVYKAVDTSRPNIQMGFIQSFKRDLQDHSLHVNIHPNTHASSRHVRRCVLRCLPRAWPSAARFCPCYHTARRQGTPTGPCKYPGKAWFGWSLGWGSIPPFIQRAWEQLPFRVQWAGLIRKAQPFDT